MRAPARLATYKRPPKSPAQVCPPTEIAITSLQGLVGLPDAATKELAAAAPIVVAVCTAGATVNVTDLKSLASTALPAILTVVQASPLADQDKNRIALGIMAAQIVLRRSHQLVAHAGRTDRAGQHCCGRNVMSRPIRVALSGSGFRLSAHLGALQAIADAGYEVIELAGTSGGSIVAALYASGVTLSGLEQLCMSLNWAPYMTFNAWTLLTKQALCTGDALLDFLMKQTGGKTFNDLAIDLKVVASDLVTESEFQFGRINTPDARSR